MSGALRAWLWALVVCLVASVTLTVLALVQDDRRAAVGPALTSAAMVCGLIVARREIRRRQESGGSS